MNVNVIQLNLHKANVAGSELLIRIGSSRDFLCLLQEPCTFKKKLVYKPRSSLVIPSSTVAEDPRAAIMASNKLGLSEIPSLEDRDTAVCIGKIKGIKTLIASVYLDSTNKEVISSGLSRLLSFANEHRLPLLIGMDSNCHSLLFGDRENRRGKILEEFIFENDLSVENSGSTPTFQSTRYSSYIDVTLTRDLDRAITKWRVDTSFNGSDHNTILFELASSMIEIPSYRPWDRANWDIFTEELEKAKFYRPKCMTDSKADKLLGKIYKVIDRAIEKACPMTKSKKVDSINDWFTDGLAKMKEKVHLAYDLHRKYPSSQSIRCRYKSLQKKYRRELRSSRRKSWNQFKSKVADTKETSKLIKILERKDSNAVATLTKPDGKPTMPGTETAELLFRHHFPQSTPRVTTHFRHFRVPTYEIEARFDDWITPDVVKEALLKFKKKKSPGPDGLMPIVFRYLPDNIFEIITFLYKSCVALAFTPRSWKQTRVVFIPKPGKKDYTDPSSFRAISLSNYLLKGLERLAVWRMDISLKEFPIHDSQHGFRIDRSTESAISEVLNEIESNIFDRKRSIVAFLDIKSAFDSISTSHIRRSLINHGAPLALADWYYGYLKHRDMHLELHGSKVVASNGQGFPQGGVASARFWAIAFNMAVKIINTNNCVGVAFADDCAVLSSGIYIKRMLRNLQKTLDHLTRWGRSCNLFFNPSKTVVVNFARRETTLPFQISVNNQLIPYSKSARYLGLMLDEKLRWSAHVENKIAAAKKLLIVVNKAVRGNWGPSPALSRWAYLGIVRPAITYASFCWANARLTKKHRKDLEKIDRYGLKFIAQTAPSVPTVGLAVIYDVPPLKISIDALAIQTWLRLGTLTDLEWGGLSRGKKPQKSHRKFVSDLAKSWNISRERLDHVKVVADKKNFRTITDSIKGDNKYLCLSQYNVFSDGSRTENGVGSGVCLLNNKKEVLRTYSARLPDFSTVFQAEVYAINMAARLISIEYSDCMPKYIKIFTDSAAALYALGKRHLRSECVKNAVDSLNYLASKGPSVSIVWIKAHVGHFGNEVADSLAKEATELNETEAVQMGRPINSIKNAISGKAYRTWASIWLNQKQARMTKQFFPVIDNNMSKNIYTYNRKDVTLLVGLITGHNDLNYHANLRGKSETSNCRYCGYVEETFYHLFAKCPRFAKARVDICGAYEIYSTFSWSPDQIITFSRLIPALRSSGYRP